MDGFLKPVTLPRAEPIALQEAKDHLREDRSDQDVYIQTLIAAAREEVEKVTGRSLILQTWDYALDAFPAGEKITVPRPPLQALDSLTYYDDDLSTSTVFSALKYQVDTIPTPPVVALKFGESWPSDTLRQSSGVVLRYRAGYEVPFTVDADTDTLTAVDHWFSAGDVVRVRLSGGDTDALPGGLEADTDYYVISPSGDDLQLSTSEGGSAVDITGAGTGTFFIGPDPVPAKLRQYMLLLIGSMHEHRELEVTDGVLKELEWAASLLTHYRVWHR